MTHKGTWAKAWALLEPEEKRSAWIMLSIVILGAVSSMVMVGSVMPFLAVLSDPDRIEVVPQLAWAYEFFGFTSIYGFLIALGGITFVTILLTSLMQIAKNYAVVRFAQMRGHSISLRLLQSYLNQPYVFFLDRHSGDMSTRLLSEAGQVVNQFYKPAADLIAGLLTATLIIGLLLWVDWAVTLVAFGILGGAYVGLYTVIRLRLRGLGKTRLEANRTRFRLAGEAFGGIKELKVTGRESLYADRYEAPSLQMAQALVLINVLSNVPQYLLQAIAFGGIVVLCLALIDPQNLASGQGLATILPILGVFAFAGQRLMPEMARVYGSMAQLQVAIHGVNAVYDDLITAPAAMPYPATSATAPSAIGTSTFVQPRSDAALAIRQQIALQDVGFQYPNAERPGLEAISLSIKAGEKVAIVGATGAGKTTLADIVLGLLTPSQGQIQVDGTPITEANHAAWKNSVGYVPQDIFLTDSSVSENIALGLPPALIDQARVTHAARIARIDDFIRSDMPQGYDTPVGERGVRLSGGQRQRIGIARALYHDPSLIVFDEATSALDNLTESEVMDAINALPGDKTVLMIAHRLSTVRHCDRILVLDHGRISGLGTWDELEANNAIFRVLAQGVERTAAA